MRLLQEKSRLELLLKSLQEEAQQLATKRDSPRVPIFLKISPDLAEGDLEDVAEVSLSTNIAGVIATNTTISRPGKFSEMERPGGLSGSPVKQLALCTLKRLSNRTEGRIPLIGVGGISSVEDAYERIAAGASVIQLYTSLVYEGPMLPRNLNKGLVKMMEREGLATLKELVGTKR